ncbi:AEC family transporter [Aquibacillus sediminis]|uniref:AEC family transporter n=1 Tax=Aquibacillus sediminis TaxID=2574734 RepID=UPI0011089674|nr:AEC family transporter [Aquibacillus sediminis]
MVLFEVIIPIFAIMLCGFLAGRLALLPSNGGSSLNYFVYYFALPALLFSSISTAPVDQIINVNFILANLFTVLDCFALTVLLFKVIFKKRFPELSMYAMITTYGNTGFLGIPLLVAAFGQDAAVPAAIVTFIYDLTIVTLVVLTFELKKVAVEEHNSQAKFLPMVGWIVKSIVLNPINASLLLGVTVAIFQLSLPEPIYVFTDVLGPAAGPTALFALGLGLTGERNILKGKNYRFSEFMTLLSLKLIILPLVAAYFVYIVFPLEDNLWAMAVIILSAMPTGAVVNVFADKYQTLVKQAPLYILATTIISIITISIILIIIVG